VEARRALVRDRVSEDAEVIVSVVVRLAEAWVLCATIQLVLWLVAERTRNAGIVDVGWAASFTAVAGLYGLTAAAPREGYLPIGIVVIAWSTRLACYLIARGAATGAEEGRYVDLRQRWALAASRRFFVFFQAQGALAALLSSAFVIPFVALPWDNGAVRVLGVMVAVIGVFGESVADAQLLKWKQDPANRGRVCDVGLWGWSRHPNYFFEWCVWLGFAIYGLAFAPSGGWIAFGGQALIFATIWKVTGIPATEAQAVRSRGEAYREYQVRVSKFVPMPPKYRA
jgi:steroid 5-alpha reductase family enzyme